MIRLTFFFSTLERLPDMSSLSTVGAPRNSQEIGLTDVYAVIVCREISSIITFFLSFLPFVPEIP